MVCCDFTLRCSQAHTGPVHALYSCEAGFVSGGKDGLVKLWSPLMDLVGEFNMKERGSIYPCIRSVCWDPQRKRLLVGTLGSEIFELNAKDGSVIHDGPVMNGHFKDELWGLSWHPTKPEFATVGDDAMLRIWDAKSFKQLKWWGFCVARAWR
jgi:WD40 repeat protein